jgi:hypothetical protein
MIISLFMRKTPQVDGLPRPRLARAHDRPARQDGEQRRGENEAQVEDHATVSS